MSIATAASRATASASAISLGLQSPTVARWKAEHAEEPLLRDDRRRQDGAHAVLGEPADVAEAAVVERRRLEHVADGDRAAQPARRG